MPTLSASPCACVGTRSGSPASLTLPSKRTWLSPPSTHTLILARKTNNLYSSSCVSSVQNARVRPTYLSLSPAISPMLRYVTCESGGPAPGSRSRSRRVEPDKRNRGTPNLLSLSEPSNFGRDHCTGFCRADVDAEIRGDHAGRVLIGYARMLIARRHSRCRNGQRDRLTHERRDGPFCP